MSNMDVTFVMRTGHHFVAPKITEEEFKVMMDGYRDPNNYLIGIPNGEDNMRFLVREHIVFIEVSNYVQ